jgi:long-chain acyl-CoA synthetase
MPITTVTEMFLVAIRHDKPDCLLHKVDGEYRPVSSAEFYTLVRRVAAALRAFGVERGDRVGLMADNSVHWAAIDYGTLAVGAILVPIYPTLTPVQAAYVANDCGAEVVFVQGRERYQGMLDERADMPQVRRFVVLDAEAEAEDTTSMSRLLADTEPMELEAFEALARKVDPGDLATFIYTSGTTGKPKGVMLSHGNLASNLLAASQAVEVERRHTALSFLPLSHSFERTTDYIYFYKGATIAYAESVQTVAHDMMEVRPHFFVSVPRVYEKVINKVRENVAVAPPLRRKIFAWA